MLPEKAKLYPEVGEVLAVGLGDAYGYPTFLKTTVKPGDKIYYSKDRAYKITLKGETYYIIKERDAFGIIGEDEL